MGGVSRPHARTRTVLVGMWGHGLWMGVVVLWVHVGMALCRVALRSRVSIIWGCKLTVVIRLLLPWGVEGVVATTLRRQLCIWLSSNRARNLVVRGGESRAVWMLPGLLAGDRRDLRGRGTGSGVSLNENGLNTTDFGLNCLAAGDWLLD